MDTLLYTFLLAIEHELESAFKVCGSSGSTRNVAGLCILRVVHCNASVSLPLLDAMEI